MWILQGNETAAGKVHYLICGQTLKVGRNESFIQIRDSTVSRKHAIITLTHPRANLESKKLSKVEIQDLGSKFGTFINDNIKKNIRLSPNVPHELHHGDIIRFGNGNTWRLEHQPLIVTTSTLKKGGEELIDALLTLGGHLQKEWSSDCSYLVMPSIIFTIKVACALASCRSIVLPKFFTELVDAILNKRPHPNPDAYLPPVMEVLAKRSGASFTPDKRRATVFNGLTFLYSSQASVNKMCTPIQNAGGKVELLTEDNFRKVVSEKHLLMGPATESEQSDSLYSRTHNLVKEHSLRIIQESEIASALLLISTDGHCNPSFRPSDIFKRPNTSQPSEKLKIYATETQATECSVSMSGFKVVPESGVPKQSTSVQDNEDVKPDIRKIPKRPLITCDSVCREAKRMNRAPSPDLTQRLSTMELCQENMEVSVKEEPSTEFEPEHTSTQRNYPSSSVTQDPCATVSFAPYTLPSLKTIEPQEVEEKTQTFHSVACDDGKLREGIATKLDKEGPHVVTSQEKNLNFDEWWKEEGAVSEISERKRIRDNESPQQENCKKSKCNEKESNISSQDNHNDGRNKRQVLESDEVLFSLPPRTKSRERTVHSLSSKLPPDAELFALPPRSSRRRRLPSVPDTASVPPTPPVVPEDSPAVTTTPEVLPTLACKKEEFLSSKFIDREGASIIEESDSTGDVTLSHTVVVVEPMVIPRLTPSEPPSSSPDGSSGLTNFKKFKKVNTRTIHKIITVAELEENIHMAGSQELITNFLDSQETKNEVLKKKQPSSDEELFDLGLPKRKRRC